MSKPAFAAAATLCLFAVPAQAQELKTGIGVLCDTGAQVQRVLEAGPKQAGAAIEAINAAEPKACGVLAVVYVEGKAQETVRNRHGTFRVFGITVLGVAQPGGIHPVPPLQQFTFVRIPELEA